MKINRILLIILFLFMVVSIFFAREMICIYLDEYALRVTQEKFGSQPLMLEQEAKIKSIAQEMNIAEPIIRKMNRQTLIIMGYYNAFAYFPQFLNCIPISNQPFLFFSEGFFQDLSAEEQRFLIGHELTHIKEHHFQYLNLMWLLVVIPLLLMVWWLKRNWIKHIVGSLVPIDYQSYVQAGCVILLIYVSLLIPNLCSMAYRRCNEWVADETSLKVLKSYDGALKLFERWQKEFNIAEYNSQYGLFSSHPNLKDRRQYCINLKNKTEKLS